MDHSRLSAPGLSPLAKKKWLTSSPFGSRMAEPAAPIFLSAPARPTGLRVNWTAEASASTSRWRETAARIIRPKRTPRYPITKSAIPTASITSTPWFFLPPRECMLLRRRIRPANPSARMPKMSPVSWMLRRLSRLRRWLNSCATTPCSSSRVSAWSAPSVTATTASSTPYPAANALMPGSSGST